MAKKVSGMQHDNKEQQQEPRYEPEILEYGDIYFFYRPKVGSHEVKSIDDVRRFFMVTSPEETATKNHKEKTHRRLYRKAFADSLELEGDRKLFLKMLNKCHKYVIAVNAKGAPFPTEPLIMALLLLQHKMIKWLSEQVSKYKN
jgi:hypothetical protein